MKSIGRNENLINQLSEELSLTSSKLYKLDIYLNNENLYLDAYLKLLYSRKEDILKLKFSQIEEYSFYYKSNYIFFNVEIYKFFQSKNGIYISFDPEDENEIISDMDQDYILCKNVEGFLISKNESILLFK